VDISKQRKREGFAGAVAVLLAVLATACGGGKSPAKPGAPAQPWPQATRGALIDLRASETAIAAALDRKEPVANVQALCEQGLHAIDEVSAERGALPYGSVPSTVDATGTLRQQQGLTVLGDWMGLTIDETRESMTACANGILLDPNRKYVVNIRLTVDHPDALNTAIGAVDLWIAGKDIPDHFGQVNQ
jgi:hypothetical protein